MIWLIDWRQWAKFRTAYNDTVTAITKRNDTVKIWIVNLPSASTGKLYANIIYRQENKTDDSFHTQAMCTTYNKNKDNLIHD